MTREAEIPLPPQDDIEALRETYWMIKKTERDARIADQLKELKPLEKALSATQIAFQNLSPATWETIGWMARHNTSGHHLLTLVGIPDSDSPPKPDEIKRINEWVNLMLSHVTAPFGGSMRWTTNCPSGVKTPNDGSAGKFRGLPGLHHPR